MEKTGVKDGGEMEDGGRGYIWASAGGVQREKQL